MDPAETPPLADVIRHQGVALGRHEMALTELTQRVTDLAQLLSNLAASLTPPSPPPPPPASLPPPAPHVGVETSIPPPERFSGEAKKCRGFLLQCSLTFELQPSRFPSERSKVAFIISLLTGRALAWATALWEQNAPECASEVAFSTALKDTFFHPTGGREAGPRLLELSQGGRSVADYVIEFRTLAAECGWDEGALVAIFHRGLGERIKDELATRDLPTSLPAFYLLATSIDTRLRQRARERGPHQPFVRPQGQPRVVSGDQDPEPMQLGSTRGAAPPPSGSPIRARPRLNE